MAKISTKELITRYIDSELDDATQYKLRGHIDRDELYEYEEKIGKQLVDMSLEEILDMIFSFRPVNVPSGAKKSLSKRTINELISRYRAVIYYYSENIADAPINNPLRSNAKTSKLVGERMAKRDRFDHDDYVELIQSIRSSYSEEYANYLECLVVLLYSGVTSLNELVTIKREQINYEEKCIEMQDRTIMLSDRCVELLEFVDLVKEIQGGMFVYKMVGWHGSVIKIPTRIQRTIEEIDTCTKEEFAYRVGKQINRLREVSDLCVNAYDIVMVGFYDYLVDRYGYDEIREAFVEHGGKRSAEILAKEAPARGFGKYNTTNLKDVIATLAR